MKLAQNWVDRLVGTFDPVAALRRAQARGTMALLGGTEAYHGVDPRRRANRNRSLPRTSGDSATLPNLTSLREESRDLVRNNPIAGGAVAGVTTSVVGTGLSVQPQILSRRLKLSDAAAAEWQRDAKELFELWAARAEWCDMASRLNFYGLQELAFRSALESGDAFALLPSVRLAGEPISTKVQLIEADRVCNPAIAGNDEWAGGIQVDGNGRPLRAAVARKHPADGMYLAKQEFDLVDFLGARTGRRNLLHLYAMLRPGQRRGVPYLAPIIEPLRQIGLYTDAEIMAAVVQGAFTVFVKKPEADSPLPPPGESSGGQVPPGAKDGSDVGLDYGAIVDLLPGEDVEMANPARPNSAFDPFVQAIFTQIGIALELPKEVLLKYYSSSYSAARAALLDAWRFFRKRREWLAAQFCQPVYEAVITEAVLSGKLSAPGFVRDPLVRACYLRAIWIGDAPGSIDPLKEVDAAGKRLEIGISDKAAETVAHSGRNWEDVHAQRVRERQAEQRDGLAAQPPTAEPSEAAAPEDDPADDGAEEDKDAMATRLIGALADGQHAIAAAIAAQQPPVVNVMPAAAPVVNVAPPSVLVEGTTIRPSIVVEPASIVLEAVMPAAAAPQVDVHLPAEGPREQLIERDESGEIRRIVTRPVEGEA
jgi:lambda family phage portal protein